MTKSLNKEVDKAVDQAMSTRKFIACGKKAVVFIRGENVEFENPGAYDNLRNLVHARLTRTATA